MRECLSERRAPRVRLRRIVAPWPPAIRYVVRARTRTERPCSVASRTAPEQAVAHVTCTRTRPLESTFRRSPLTKRAGGSGVGATGGSGVGGGGGGGGGGADARGAS